MMKISSFIFRSIIFVFVCSLPSMSVRVLAEQKAQILTAPSVVAPDEQLIITFLNESAEVVTLDSSAPWKILRGNALVYQPFAAPVLVSMEPGTSRQWVVNTNDFITKQGRYEIDLDYYDTSRVLQTTVSYFQVKENKDKSAGTLGLESTAVIMDDPIHDMCVEDRWCARGRLVEMCCNRPDCNGRFCSGDRGEICWLCGANECAWTGSQNDCERCCGYYCPNNGRCDTNNGATNPANYTACIKSCKNIVPPVTPVPTEIPQ